MHFTVQQFVKLIDSDIMSGNWHPYVSYVWKDAENNMVAFGNIFKPRIDWPDEWWPDGPHVIGIYNAEMGECWSKLMSVQDVDWLVDPVKLYDISDWRVFGKTRLKYKWENSLCLHMQFYNSCILSVGGYTNM